VIDLPAFPDDLDRDVAPVETDVEGAEPALLERPLGAPEAARIGATFAETHEAGRPELHERPVLGLR
jgi:hypothetical protein